MRIYLSGGMHSGWQQCVKRECPGPEYLDPCEHGLTDPVEYTKWDLVAVRRSDLVFAYMERGNPTGYGMCLEIGYALGLGIPVLLVDEKQVAGMAIIREASAWLHTALSGGLLRLQAMIESERMRADK